MPRVPGTLRTIDNASRLQRPERVTERSDDGELGSIAEEHMTPVEMSIREGHIVLTDQVKDGVALHKLIHQEREIVKDADVFKLQWLKEILERNNLGRY